MNQELYGYKARPDGLTALGLSGGNKVFGTMLPGRPRFAYHRIPLRNQPAIT
ncbi:MAG TPA: hypothetical protein VMW83_07285 [Spirochaetia bacterium]|nr:hypothetical protein [Spirochaetia bacterium]